MAAFRFAIVAQVDDFDAFQADAFFCGNLGQAFFVTQQDRNTDTFGLGFGSGFQHIDMVSFGEYHTFRIGFCHIGEAAEQFVVISHHFAQMVGIAVPVGDRLAGNTRFDSRFGNCTGNTCQQARVERFRQDVITSESRPFQLVGGVHNVGDRFFGQLGDCVNGS